MVAILKCMRVQPSFTFTTSHPDLNTPTPIPPADSERADAAAARKQFDCLSPVGPTTQTPRCRGWRG
jgi:hypothetical protein